MDDDRIIELFFARSEQAVTELSRKYGTVCRRTAENILNDRRDAEECLNDAYLAVWNTVPPQRPDPLLSYVCRIVRNQALKRYHANAARKRNSVYDAALEEIMAMNGVRAAAFTKFTEYADLDSQMSFEEFQKSLLYAFA